MDYKELKKTEAGYLASNSKVFRQYGKVLKYFLDKYSSYSKNCCSDDVLFSDIAKKYIASQRHDMQFVRDKEDYKLRISYAAEFIIKNFASKDLIETALENYDGEYTFEDVNNFLSKSYLYNKIHPETLEKIISEKRVH